MQRRILGRPATSAIQQEKGKAGSPSRAHLHGSRLQQRLRESRSRSYVEAMSRLDLGSHTADETVLGALIDAIANEFPELTIDQRPIGIVQRCYLGPPYEVHICDLGLRIIEHYETYRSMPGSFERARTLALHPSYAFVEVYADALRAVSPDGSVSVISV